MHMRCNNNDVTLNGLWTRTGWATFGRSSRWWTIGQVEHYAPFDVSRAVDWYSTVVRVAS